MFATSFKTALFASAALLAGAASASAGTQSFSAKIGPLTTNFINQAPSPSIAQFNSALGTLTSVSYVFTGILSGSDKQESLDASPSTVNSTFAAAISLSLGGTTVTTVSPSQSFSDAFTRFDGEVDFGGRSGTTHGGLSLSVTTSGSIANLASFIGNGTVPFSVTALGQTSANGSGNLISQFQTQAEGDVTLTYTYAVSESVPEPASMALLAPGLAGLGVLRRRR